MQLADRQRLFHDMMRALLLMSVISVVCFVAYPGAKAENLDEGKPAARLFADGCAACHHGARGLTKGRFTVTLYLFLQQHYASNSSSAWALANYLESVDQGRQRSSRSGARRSSPSRAPESFQRPPMPIPQH
jgi:hypothetical protein